MWRADAGILASRNDLPLISVTAGLGNNPNASAFVKIGNLHCSPKSFGK